jgi:transcriptional regulator with XRE-family HTH domain
MVVSSVERAALIEHSATLERNGRWAIRERDSENKTMADGKTVGKRKGRAASRANQEDRSPSGIPNPVDIHVGSRVRLRRTLLGLSQEKLGEAVGLTFQQIQKYERGANRIGASRLFEFSRILDVPVSFFFDDMSARARATEGDVSLGLSDQPQAPLEPDPLTRRETLELVRAYYRIGDPQVRKRLFELTKSLGTLEDAE